MSGTRMTVSGPCPRPAEGRRGGAATDPRAAANATEVRRPGTPTIANGGRPRKCALAALAVVSLLGPATLPAADEAVLLREEFTSLEAWRPLTFPKIERHSTYSIETNDEKSEFWLKAESDRSASGLVWKKQYDVYEHPRLRWRWRVENVYEKGDATKKSGDDYPIRVYVIFQYDPAGASAGKRIKYGFAKALYGEYPPDSGVNYVWESRDNPAEFVVSPYTGSMMMYLKERGPAKVGEWVEEQADVLEDYRRAFGKDPPHSAGLAVMNDSDNTGEKAVSFIDWIEIAR